MDDSFAEPEQATWVTVSVRMTKRDGTVVKAEFLRPREWVARHKILPGAALPIAITELEVEGNAIVTAISPCPQIATGEGRVVTGRFVTREAGNLVRLALENGTEIRATDVHPVWSVDREEWVPAGELEPGELVDTIAGPVAVLSVERLESALDVYNIEVHGEHVFRVTADGVLVHNACALPILGRPPHGKSQHNSAMVATALTWIRGGMSNVRTNQALSDGVRTISNLRPDVQGMSNGLIYIAEVNVTGGPGYHAARELVFRQILGQMFGSYSPL